ncbi:hypothetical protein H4Q26_014237, partial [Puccinia striiformis f. sp. tritici PST-130]
LGDPLTIDQVDEWLKEAEESRPSWSSSPTSDLEVHVVDSVGSHSTPTTGSVKRQAVDQCSHQKSRPLVGSTAGAPTPANTGTQDEEVSDPNEDKIKINLEYKLHVRKKNKKQVSTQGSNKRKAGTTASAQAYTKLVVNKEVTFANPPNSLPFDFITADEYHSKYQGGRSSSPQRSTSQNHIGAGSPQTPQGTAGDQAINNSTPFANLNELFANHPNLLPVSHFNAMHLGGIWVAQ